MQYNFRAPLLVTIASVTVSTAGNPPVGPATCRPFRFPSRKCLEHFHFYSEQDRAAKSGLS
jgi:hypothetical protein